MSEDRLFDCYVRTGSGPRRHTQSSFDYLNTSGRAEVEAIRAMLEEWYTSYPEDAKKELRARFRSSDDWQHFGAFFELYIHELLCGMGFMVTAHPQVPGGKERRPDFLVSTRHEPVFYAECTIKGCSDDERAAQARINEVYEVLDQLESPDFWLEVSVWEASDTPIRGRELRRKVASWLTGLSWEAISQTEQDAAESPLFCWSDDGWDIEIRPICKSPEVRGRSGIRPIGIILDNNVSSAGPEAIRAAIMKKGRRYGELDLPYILFINVLSELDDHEDVHDALLGTRSIIYDPQAGEGREYREQNGAWYREGTPRYTRMSALGYFVQLNVWSIKEVEPVLIHHPWASRPLRPELWRLNQLIPDHEMRRYHLREGEPVTNFLRISQRR